MNGIQEPPRHRCDQRGCPKGQNIVIRSSDEVGYRPDKVLAFEHGLLIRPQSCGGLAALLDLIHEVRSIRESLIPAPRIFNCTLLIDNIAEMSNDVCESAINKIILRV